MPKGQTKIKTNGKGIFYINGIPISPETACEKLVDSKIKKVIANKNSITFIFKDRWDIKSLTVKTDKYLINHLEYVHPNTREERDDNDTLNPY